MGKGRKPRLNRLVLLGLSLGIAAACGSPSSALANTVLHVDAVHGSDTGNCQASPCKTLSYAITQGESVPDLITIVAAPGTYTGDLSLGSKDSGLTITGAGSGTNPASSTIIEGVSGPNTIETSASGPESALTLNHLRIVNPSSDNSLVIEGGATDLSLSDVAIDDEGPGNAILAQSLTTSGGLITLSNSGSGDAVIGQGGPLTFTGTPITEDGTGLPIVDSGNASLSLVGSPISMPNSSNSSPALVTGSGPATLYHSPIDSAGTGVGVDGGGGPVSIIDSPITLTNTSGGLAVIDSGAEGSVAITGSRIDVHGTGEAVITGGAPAALSDDQITLDNASNGAPALILDGRGSSLSHVSVSGAWNGIALDDTGSLTVSDSSLTSGPSPTAPLVLLSDGGSTGGSDVSITRSALDQRTTTELALDTGNVNLAVASSELLGGRFSDFGVSGGVTRSLTVVSSTIDAGLLGVRDAPPVHSLDVSTDNTSGTDAVVNVEGSILVESPEASVGGSSASATVNCSYTEVPNTTQAAPAAINCGTGSHGNTFTSSLGAIFAHPGSSYALNPTWNGIDSVPVSAISLPAPFTDSSTDLVGTPRDLDGNGTCEPGLRDKGAIELTGHAGVVPAPKIAEPNVFARSRATFRGSAPNVPAGVPLTFAWHSSDGAHGSGRSFIHAFARRGIYTVSLTVNGAAGCTGSTSRRVRVYGADQISRLAISPRSFRAARSGGSISTRHGALVSYLDSAPARTTFTVQRKTGSGRWVKVGTFGHVDRAGRTRFRFTGRVGGHTLSAGTYRLEVVPVNPAGKGRAHFVGFHITG